MSFVGEEGVGQLDRGEKQDSDTAVGDAANHHTDHGSNNALGGEKRDRSGHDHPVLFL